MIYGSVCSGIEAATVAWHRVARKMCMNCEGLTKYHGKTCEVCKGDGSVPTWKAAWYSEIEKFPSAVLKHHYPNTPNLGDMTKIHELKEFNERPIELLVGGTPCQSFSVAGLRKGLDDPRGNLALVFLKILDLARPRWVVWENVPGVLSSRVGRDFGAFLGGLGELGYGWAYRVLDAQHFGVPQRRRRVFVVGYLGDRRRAAAVLFERESLSGNPPPGRTKRKGFAPAAPLGAHGGSGYRQDLDNETYVPLLNGMEFEREREREPIPELSHCLNAGGMRRQHFETETLIPSGGHFDGKVAGTLQNSGRAAGSATQQDAEDGLLVPISIHPRALGRDKAGPEGKDFREDGQSFTMDTSGAGAVVHSLRGEGFDASEDGTGRGIPLIAGTLNASGAGTNRPAGQGNELDFVIPISTMAAVSRHGKDRIGIGIGAPGDPSSTLSKAHQHAIAFMAGAGAGAGSTGASEEVTPTLKAANSGSNRTPSIASNMQVRRLTPRECERLQGFPDDYTLIPNWVKSKVKPEKLDRDYLKYLCRGGVLSFEECMTAATDGPRYKACGNSMAVPVMQWLGERIEMADKL